MNKQLTVKGDRLCITTPQGTKPGKMNNQYLLFLFLILSSITYGQGAVAVVDSIKIEFGGYVTVNVTNNDYHPEGKSFKIQNAFDAYSYTDSTITYFANYKNYYNVDGYISLVYLLIDEDDLIGEESDGRVFLEVNNQHHKAYLDVNNIRANINAWGNQFWQGYLEFNSLKDSIHFEYPVGSGRNTLFNQTIWVGGYDQAMLKLSADRYRKDGSDYWTGPISTNGGNLSVDTLSVYKWNRVWKLNVDEVIYHRQHWHEQGYEPINSIKTWPAHGDESLGQNRYLAPFIDTDGDGYYDPYTGDYPLIRGDQCIYYVFNDLKEHTESAAENIGLEIHGMAYEFNSTENTAMNNTVFLSYKIFNRSNNVLDDTYVGLFCDFDIGNPDDDFVGCDVSRGAFYGYNGNEYDATTVNPETGEITYGYGENPPAQGIIILGGPYIDSNNLDDPHGGCDQSITGVGFGDGIVDNERFGMTKYMYFNNSDGVQGDPILSEEYYQFMEGIWKDGTAMEYGGNGHISSGSYGPACNFMYPGLSDPCYWGTDGEEPFGPVNWTEEIAENDPGDRRGLSVMGPFTFLPGSMQKVDLAFVVAQGEDGPLSSVGLLQEYIDQVKIEYFKDSDHFGYQWLGTEEKEMLKNSLHIYPNPSSSSIWVELDSPSNEILYNIHDVFGKLVKQGQLSANGHLNIPVSDLESGLYIVTIKADTKVYTSKLLKR